jgi:hypothetical protein
MKPGRNVRLFLLFGWFVLFFSLYYNMKENVNYIAPIYKLALRDATTVPRKISYSQWSMYEKCPKQWKLSYIDGLAPFQSSIDTCFGTAFHETLQTYLTVMYTDSIKNADRIDLRELLTTNLRNEYARTVAECGGEHYSNPLQLAEYLEDGTAILQWFKNRRKQYFSTKDWELIAIELELCTPASEHNPSVFWYGFIDVVMRNTKTGEILIIDIKTSRNGWNKYQKTDSLKLAQLVAYKNYFHKQFGTPLEKINIEFFIVKRKLVEESMFPQKRIQQLRPASGTVTQRKVQKSINAFVDHCFDATGAKNVDAAYTATAGKGAKNCKYCPFKEDYENCPKESRIRE